jgi:hypothetical protein
MYGKTNLEFNQKRLKLANDLFDDTPWPDRHCNFFLKTDPFKNGHFWRRDGKSLLVVHDALTFALMRPGSIQVILAPIPDQREHIIERCGVRIAKAQAARNIPHPLLDDGVVRKDHIIMGVSTQPTYIAVFGYNTRPYTEDKVVNAPMADRVLIDDIGDRLTPIVLSAALQMLENKSGDLIMVSDIHGGQVPTDVPWISLEDAERHNAHFPWSK